MTAIWSRTSDGWRVLEPAGFPDEASLHLLVEEAPEVLPLSGSPALAILAREFVIGTGSADLLGVEPSGRVVLIEVKLAKNAEARRAVVAQILAYAAFLKGTSRETMQVRLEPHLAKKGHKSVTDAVEGAVQDGSFDASAFLDGIEHSLDTGEFRLVLVLDTAPPELVRLVGYLESIAPQLTIDLVTVSKYEVNGAPALVPQRVDPEREPIPKTSALQPGGQPYYVQDGGQQFRDAIDRMEEADRVLAVKLYDWAKGLAADGLAVLWTHSGPSYTTIVPRVIGHGAGLVTVVSDGTLWTWPSVFEKKAPASIDLVTTALGGPMKHGGAIKAPSDEVLSAVGSAYAEAVVRRDSSTSRGGDVERQSEA